jgi:hypothetical protein
MDFKGMKKIIVSIVLLFACSSCVRPQSKCKLDPPPGYVVQELDYLGGCILRPDDWHYRCIYKNGTLVFQIAKEALSSDKQFETGFTINVVPGVSKKTGIRPSLYAQKFIDDKLKSSVLVFREPTSQIKEPAFVDGVCTRDAVMIKEEMEIFGKKQVFMIGYTIYSYDEPDFIVIMLFGTPVSLWEESAEIYKTITQDVFLINPGEFKKNLPKLTGEH